MTMARRNLFLIASIAASIGCHAAAPVFNPDSYLRHVKFLASDELQGRGNGTPELDKAAEYIAAEFKSRGVFPGGDDGGYFQKFMVTTGSRLGPGNRLTLLIGPQSVETKALSDFTPVGVGEKTGVSGGIVFAGYGITAEEYHYDDYKGLDVTDKVVLVLTDEPGENDPNSPFNGKEMTLHSHDNSKVANAKFRGARAILIAQDPANHEDAGKDLPDSGLLAQVEDLGIPALRVTRGVAQRLLDAEHKSLLDLQKQIDSSNAPQSFVLRDVQAQIEMDVSRVRKEVRNVLGILPGTEDALADESVVIGAHYDHLGRGGRSSMSAQLIGQIHHGADDNASGTAGLIEVAGALAQDLAARKRCYLFIAFAGEEIGLRGSDYWVNHPTRPLAKVIAMLNMDMIGRSRENAVTVGGVGTSPMLPDLVKTAAAESGLALKTSQSGYGSSDHASFYIKNMPVLFFFSGLHADYHRPSDEWQRINAEGATRIVRMVYTIAQRLDSIDPRPQFTKVDEPAPGPGRGGAPGYGTYFGSVPDMTDEVKGVRFADVRPNSPAAKAGLKGQDIMIRFDGKEIQNLQDFTYMLRTHKPGDVVEVVVTRDGQPLAVKVTLEVRR
jgi:hypothetical protein